MADWAMGSPNGQGGVALVCGSQHVPAPIELPVLWFAAGL